jgi:hypothetical protein
MYMYTYKCVLDYSDIDRKNDYLHDLEIYLHYL